MAINKINQLEVASGFTPSTGAVVAGDNAQVALEKLQGAKANLVATPTANHVLLTDASGQPIQSAYTITTDGTLPDNHLATTNAIKEYLSASALGLQLKDPCAVTTTGDIVLTGLQVIDGYSVQDGDRVLVRLQTDATENGIYVAGAGAWVRSNDASEWAELINAYTFVFNGDTKGGDGFTFNIPAVGTVGTDPINIQQFLEGTSIKAGDGIEISANTTIGLSSEYAFSANTTAGNTFDSAVEYQYFNDAIALDADTMQLGKRYTFTAQGANSTITLTNGVFRGFTALGTTTTQLLNDGESLDFILVEAGIVQIA